MFVSIYKSIVCTPPPPPPPVIKENEDFKMRPYRGDFFFFFL